MQGQRSSEFWFISGIVTCQALFGALFNAKFRRRYGKVHSVEEVEEFVRKNYRMSLDHYWQHHRFDKAQIVEARTEVVEKSETKIISDYYEFVCKMRDISIEQFFAEYPDQYDRWRRVCYLQQINNCWCPLHRDALAWASCWRWDVIVDGSFGLGNLQDRPAWRFLGRYGVTPRRRVHHLPRVQSS